MKFNTFSSFESTRINHRPNMPSFWNIKKCDFDLQSKQAAESRAKKILQISMLEELTFKDSRNKNLQSHMKTAKKKQKDQPVRKNDNKNISNLKKSLQEEKDLMRILIKDEEGQKYELLEKKKRDKMTEMWQSKKLDKNASRASDETSLIKAKKRAKSIATYLSRPKIKFHLSPLQKSELTMLFSESNLHAILSNPSRKRRSMIEPEIKHKLKYKAKSLDVERMGESLTNFYINLYLKHEKGRQEKQQVQINIEKRGKIKSFKQRTKKDKYFLPGTVSYSDLQLNQFKATSTRFTNCSTTHTSGFNSTNSKFNSQNTNYNSLNTNNNKLSPEPKTLTNFSRGKQTLPSITFGLTTTDHRVQNSNQTQTSQNLLDSPNKNSNINKFKQNCQSQKKHFTSYHNLSKDIVSKCTTATNLSNKLKEELGSVVKMYSGNIEYCKRIMGKSDLQEMKEELTKDNKMFKEVKRFFIQPLGKKKKEFVSSDERNALRQAKQVETLNEDMAYKTRGLIFNKFDTKLDKEDIINYVPDVKKDETLKDFIDNYHKKKTVFNSNALQNGYLDLQIRNKELSSKVTKLVNKYKKDV